MFIDTNIHIYVCVVDFFFQKIVRSKMNALKNNMCKISNVLKKKNWKFTKWFVFFLVKTEASAKFFAKKMCHFVEVAFWDLYEKCFSAFFQTICNFLFVKDSVGFFKKNWKQSQRSFWKNNRRIWNFFGWNSSYDVYLAAVKN